MTWEQDPVDYRSWTQEYAERRYGGTDGTIEKAWDILLDTAYKHTDGDTIRVRANPSSTPARPTTPSARRPRGATAT